MYIPCILQLNELLAPPDYNIPFFNNINTQDYDLPVVTTDISVNTNSAYVTTSFGEAQVTRHFSSHMC